MFDLVMISVEIALLAAAIFVLAIGLYLVAFKIKEIERDVRYSNIRIDSLRERMLINDKFINTMYDAVISLNEEIESLKKAIQATDAAVSKMDGELLKMNDLKKQLDCLTAEIMNQKHEED